MAVIYAVPRLYADVRRVGLRPQTEIRGFAEGKFQRPVAAYEAHALRIEPLEDEYVLVEKMLGEPQSASVFKLRGESPVHDERA